MSDLSLTLDDIYEALEYTIAGFEYIEYFSNNQLLLETTRGSFILTLEVE